MGNPVAGFHKGLIGDTELRFTDLADPDSLNLIFVMSDQYLEVLPETHENLKIIYIPDSRQEDSPFLPREEWVPGVSEMFRKPLVRGALKAQVLPSMCSVSIIALFPLALHLLLNDSLKLRFGLPHLTAEKNDIPTVKTILEGILKEVQFSFDSFESIEYYHSDSRRALTVEIEMNCGVTAKEIEKIYEEVYNDHNFTYLVTSRPEPEEVEGSQKCLINIQQADGEKLKIMAMADSIFRGGVGDAVHAMNLLFGLFEKIGLSLPSSLAYK